jgi:hypothetical protein
MKNLLALLVVLAIGSSCKKSDDSSKLDPKPDPLEKVTLIVPENLYTPVQPQGDPKYNVIGYGYDVTGKHNDVSSVRGKVVNIAAYVKGEKSKYFEPWTNTAFWHDSYDAENAESLARSLSYESDVTKGKALFGGTMTELFPNTTAFSKKYVYGYYSEYLQFRSFRFFIDEELIEGFKKYLSSSFQSDVRDLTPEMIVKKYGTEVLAEIVLGAKLDILYQAETDVEERSDVQKNGYDAAIKTTFGFWTSRLNDIDSAKLRKVKSPALSFRVGGGDPSKIKLIESAMGRHVDVSDWLKTITPDNYVFIQTRSTIPLYSLIQDEKKRAEVQAYIATYLEDNQVKLVE